MVETGGLSHPAAQAGSPPPVAVATLSALPAVVGVTLMVIVTASLTDRSAMATVQLTSWPTMVQFGTALLIVMPAGTASVTTTSAVASAVPVLLMSMV